MVLQYHRTCYSSSVYHCECSNTLMFITKPLLLTSVLYQYKSRQPVHENIVRFTIMFVVDVHTGLTALTESFLRWIMFGSMPLWRCLSFEIMWLQNTFSLSCNTVSRLSHCHATVARHRTYSPNNSSRKVVGQCLWSITRLPWKDLRRFVFRCYFGCLYFPSHTGDMIQSRSTFV